AARRPRGDHRRPLVRPGAGQRGQPRHAARHAHRLRRLRHRDGRPGVRASRRRHARRQRAAGAQFGRSRTVRLRLLGRARRRRRRDSPRDRPRYRAAKEASRSKIRNISMRKAVVLLSVLASGLASAPALAAPAKSCRITVKGNGFDVGCLPALSAKGTLVALAEIDPDGDKKRPNLRVTFYPVDGRTPASTVVLTVEESAAYGGQLGADVVPLIEPRLDLANAQLSLAGFVPLKPAAADGLVVAARAEKLELSGPHVAAASYAR